MEPIGCLDPKGSSERCVLVWLWLRGTGGDTRLQRACDDSSREQRSAVPGGVLRKGGRRS